MKDEVCEACGVYHSYLATCPYYISVKDFYPESGDWYADEMKRTRTKDRDVVWKDQMLKLRVLELNYREKRRRGA